MNKEQMVREVRNCVLSIDFLNSLSDDVLVALYNQSLDFLKSKSIVHLQDTVDKYQAEITRLSSLTPVKAVSPE